MQQNDIGLKKLQFKAILVVYEEKKPNCLYCLENSKIMEEHSSIQIDWSSSKCIAKCIAGNIARDHCNVINKIYFALFTYLDTIWRKGRVEILFILTKAYALLKTCL